jgi:arylsulfatase A-like enzyme
MLLSGRWPFQTGVVDNALLLPDQEFSLGEAFRRAGYHTGYIGKWHLSPADHETGVFIPKGPGRHGFEDWQMWSNTRDHFGAFTFDPDSGARIRRKGYGCTLMADAAIDFIGVQTQRPWMLVLSWVPPHPPLDAAPSETMRLYDREALRFRPNVPFDARAGMAKYVQGYYAHISALDAELGRLLDKLDATGQTADTIVVYTSDHGTMLGSHGLPRGKRLPYDEACRVPFVVRYPGVVAADRSTELLVSTIDLFPSLCGLAGVPIPSHCEGADFSEALLGGTGPSPGSAFLMHVQKTNADPDRQGRLAPLFRGVRTARFTYAVAEDGRWCLYDDREDPYQMRNLIDDPAYVKTIDELDTLVAGWLERAHDPFPLRVARTNRSGRA